MGEVDNVLELKPRKGPEHETVYEVVDERKSNVALTVQNYTSSDSNGTANQAVEVLGEMCNTKIVVRKPSGGHEGKATHNLVTGKKKSAWGTVRLV